MGIPQPFQPVFRVERIIVRCNDHIIFKFLCGIEHLFKGADIVAEADVQSLFFQKADSTGSFFSVELLCPAFIPSRFSFSHFSLNVNKQIKLLGNRNLTVGISRLTTRLASNGSTKFFIGIIFTQGTKPDKSLLTLSTKRRLLSILELKTEIFHLFQEVGIVPRLLLKHLVNGIAQIVTLGSLLRVDGSFLSLPVRLRCNDR